MNSATKNLEAAIAAVRDGEARNLSVRTMNKLWKAAFAAQDAVKATGAWL